MTINELKNWMRDQFEQGNNILCATAGQGGSGAAMMLPERTDWHLEDVDRYDDNEISIVEDATEIDEVGIMIDHLDKIEEYDALVKLANDEGEILYICYSNGEAPHSIMVEKGAYNHDTLTFEYMGKEYSVSGEFEVNEWGNLRHTFVAPTGKEFEIVTPYE